MIGGDPGLAARQIGEVQLVGAGAAGDRAADRRRAPRRRLRRDEFAGGGPVQAHAALRGVHGVGDAEPVRPQFVPVGQGGVPVDDGRGAG